MSRVLSVLVRRARSHARRLNHRNSKQLQSLSARTIVDRSFRLANVGDLAVAQDFKDNHFVSSEHFVSFMHSADVSTRDLSQQLVIDLSHAQGYKRGHIKGAVNLPLEKFDFTRLIDAQNGGITESEIVDVMKALGVSNDTSEIILYDNSGLLASRLWFVLRYFGFTNVRVLNGGWRSWLRAGLPIEEQETSAVAAKSLDLKAKRSSIVLSPSEMFRICDDDREGANAQIIDSRRSDAFLKYHIPKALSVPSSALMIDGEFATVQNIRETLKAKGIEIGDAEKEQKRTIVYSSKGLTSAVAYFCLGMAGVENVSVYDQGIYNWLSCFEQNKVDPEIADKVGR